MRSPGLGRGWDVPAKQGPSCPLSPGHSHRGWGALPASGGDTWGLMGELGWQVQTQPNCNSVLLPLGDVPLISALSSSRSLTSQLFLENTKHAVTPGP